MYKNKYGVVVLDEWNDFAPNHPSAASLLATMDQGVSGGWVIPDSAISLMAYMVNDGLETEAVPHYEEAARHWLYCLRLEGETAGDNAILARCYEMEQHLSGKRRCATCRGTGDADGMGESRPYCNGDGWVEYLF